MYNVMIVDDEEPVLDSYTHILAKGDPSFTLIGKARSGHETIALVHQVHPDVIFMDIGMPGIDGLETIEELQKEFPEILFVISTAYERFDLAKRAIPLGVVSYLVKPISKRLFIETLQKVKKLLEEKQNKICAHVEDLKQVADLQAWEEKNFLSLITWKQLSEAEWLRYKELLSLPSNSGMICMVKITPRGGSQSSISIEELFNECVKQLSHKYYVLSTEYLGRLMILVSGAESMSRVEHLLSYILEHHLPQEFSYRIGVGTIEPYDQLFHSCDEAFRMIADELVNLQKEQQLVEGLRKSIMRSEDLSEVQKYAQNISELMLFANSFSVAKGKLIAVITLLLDDLYRALGDKSLIAIPFDHVKEIDDLQNKKAWSVWLAHTLRFIVDRSRQYHMEKRPIPLRKAIVYIDNEYEKPLQLADVAAACTVSPAYLSRLFTEHMQSSFVNYLTSVRIQHAQYLLREGNVSVKEISYQVGYQDPNYFSKIFKKIIGVSPTAYQREEGDGHG